MTEVSITASTHNLYSNSISRRLYIVIHFWLLLSISVPTCFPQDAFNLKAMFIHKLIFLLLFFYYEFRERL